MTVEDVGADEVAKLEAHDDFTRDRNTCIVLGGIRNRDSVQPRVRLLGYTVHTDDLGIIHMHMNGVQLF